MTRPSVAGSGEPAPRLNFPCPPRILKGGSPRPECQAGVVMTDRVERLFRSVLVVRCQAGDGTAFAELIGLYQPRLRYFLARLVGDEHAADDLLQEVWVTVYRG